MPKQLINVIGIVVVVAVLALGVFLVAVPLAAQYFAIEAQTQQVTQTNKLYQQQVDSLNKASENQAQIDASVTALRAQIPATPQLDSAFDLIARASQKSKVKITSVTAGDQTNFVARTSPTTLSDAKPAPAPKPTATAGGVVGQAKDTAGQANAQTAQTNVASGATTGAANSAASAARTQIDLSIAVTATDMNQVTAFLDALRAGPRLLSNITSTVAQNGSGIRVLVTGLTFVDGSTQPTTKGSK